MSNRRAWFILGAIFLLGLFLRFYNLSSFPVGFHFDEASKGYTAYSMLKTGKDDNNHIFPFYIDVFGDNSPPGYHYATIPSVAIFGLTEFAVRFPGALIGSLTILGMFFLAYTIFENKKIALLCSLLLAIAPWHINLTRGSSEGMVALFFITVGFSLIIRSLKREKIRELTLGIILLAISFFFYQTPRVFVPLLFFVLLFYLLLIWQIKATRYFKKVLITSFLVLVFLDFILIFVIPGGTGRFTQVNIFHYPETQLVMQEQFREDGILGISSMVSRMFHNKIVNFSLAYVTNYFEYFSWTFLFVKGLPSWGDIPNIGVLYLAELPFFVYGVMLLFFHKNNLYKIPLLWLFLGPAAAAVSIDTNNIQRASVMYIAMEMIAAYGIMEFLIHVRWKKIIGIAITVLFLFNVGYFLHQYFAHSMVHRTWYRYNGFKDMVLAVKKDYDKYDTIVITKSNGGIYTLVQFYMQYDPKTYQQEGSPKDANYKGFGKFLFVPIDCPSLKHYDGIPQSKHMIFVNRGICNPDPTHKEVLIRREDGTEAFRIVYADIEK